MNCLLNLFWIILGGFWNAIAWGFIGVLWCITILGIPVGKQCFKMARLSFAPFGKAIFVKRSSGSVILNILWLIFGGLPLGFAHLASGVVLCLTIIGIPFGWQQFKLMRLAFMPFGAEVYSEGAMDQVTIYYQ